MHVEALLLATSFISDDQVLNPFLNYFASFGMLFGAFNVLNSLKKYKILKYFCEERHPALLFRS